MFKSVLMTKRVKLRRKSRSKSNIGWNRRNFGPKLQSPKKTATAAAA